MTLRDTANDPAEIAKLRRLRVSFDDIAARLHLTREQVIALYRAWLDELEALKTAEHRAEQMALADDAIRDLSSIARNHADGEQTAVQAWNAIRAWAEHQAKLTGLYSGEKTADEQPGKLHALRQARHP